MKTDIITQIEAEIAALESRLTALRTAHGALTGLKAQKLSTASKRAPAGALEQAIEGVLKQGGHLGNGAIRAKLEAAGYAYSLTPLHVGKTLSRMVEAKKLKVEHKGNQWLYSLK
jgi:hypothetical protein